MEKQTYGDQLNLLIREFSALNIGDGCIKYAITPCGPDAQVVVYLNEKQKVELFYHGKVLEQAFLNTKGLFAQKRELSIPKNNPNSETRIQYLVQELSEIIK